MAEVESACADKINFESLMTKKNGKDGQKGSSDRWFVMIGGESLNYYDPKKVRLFGARAVCLHTKIR